MRKRFGVGTAKPLGSQGTEPKWLDSVDPCSIVSEEATESWRPLVCRGRHV